MAIIAITNKMWMRPPPNGVTNAPKIHTIIRITAIRYNRFPIVNDLG
jgi:hypothetical protein